ncbi:JAB domain-containing protein [Bacillaceae bacterium SIJ1]|uniref:RadC family protein n=1 Tax=Litoribacterium kuwaitense TaxID=1398745 RepID=UPI0013EAE276|nr:DNA repair protein RadC [Litoribacterium kuwaitense]NGP45489.1 JAB domain-containing protein [Litoribacterium kuwaitense]
MNKPIMIRDVPQNDRPRERLINHGAKHLSNQELLAIILQSGTKDESVMQLSLRLLTAFPSLAQLQEASLAELTSTKGIGQAKATLLLAVMELTCRLANEKGGAPTVIRSPHDASMYVMEEMKHLKQEHFVCLFLNTKNHVTEKKTIFVGSLNASIVHPREVFKEAIRASAASVLCVHNHPSGDPSPSQEDIEVTKRLSECGKVLGVELVDHLIIGNEQFISLREKGYI